MTAYSAAHTRFESFLEAPETPAPPPARLTQRQLAGIAAAPYRNLLSLVSDGEGTVPNASALKEIAQFLALFGANSGPMTRDQALKRVLAVAEAADPKDLHQLHEQAGRVKAALLASALSELEISANQQDLRALRKLSSAYVGLTASDLEKREAGDFSAGELETKAPPSPKKVVTWRDCVECWRRAQGGTIERDGFGVSEKREKKHWRYIRQFQAWTRETRGIELEAGEITAEVFRSWRLHSMSSGLSPATIRDRVACPAAVLRAGYRAGVLLNNPAADQSVRLPEGYQQSRKFSPFSKEEINQIMVQFKLNKNPAFAQLWAIAVMTGCRIGEAYRLRCHDIKRTDSGVLYFEWKFDPLSKDPMFLKKGFKNQRNCPIHPRLQEFLEIEKVFGKEGPLFTTLDLGAGVESRTSAQMARVLKQLGLYQSKTQRAGTQRAQTQRATAHRKLGWHSARASFKDLCRTQVPPISEDYRSAFCGHSNRSVGEAYGLGIAQMPDVLAKEMNRIDFDWLQL